MFVKEQYAAGNSGTIHMIKEIERRQRLRPMSPGSQSQSSMELRTVS
jgi:hypothetical protein